jgi:hypothetical protein
VCRRIRAATVEVSMRALRLLLALAAVALLPGCVVTAGPGYGYGYAQPYYAPPAVVYRPVPVYRHYAPRPYYGRAYDGRPYAHGGPRWHGRGPYRRHW